MLPLPLYYSADFRLMAPPQLFRAIQQRALTDSRVLREQFEELELTFYDAPSVTAEQDNRRNCEPPPLYQTLYQTPKRELPACTNSQANHNFNIYLKTIEAGDTAAQRGPVETTIVINPLTLQPNLSVEPSSSAQESLVRKLVALSQIAQSHPVRLLLSEPGEHELELWLTLLARLVEETPESSLGITLNTNSKRLLPALGYLAKISEEREQKLLLRLIHRPGPERAEHQLLPTIDLNDTIKLNFAAACAFLECANSGALTPELVSGDPTLQPIVASLCASQGWSLQICNDNPSPHRPLALGEYQSPCTLAGIQSISTTFDSALNELKANPVQAPPLIGGVDAPLQEEAVIYHPGAIERPVGSTATATESQIREAYTRCLEAQPNWASSSQTVRMAALESFAQLLADEKVELATLCACETGRPIEDCLLEIEDALILLHRHLTLATKSQEGRKLVSTEDSEVSLLPSPLGSILGIVPRYQPVLQFCAISSGALLTGNALLLAPLSGVSLISYRLCKLLLRSNIPNELIALLPGAFESAFDTLFDDFRLAAVIFNGSAIDAAAIQKRLSSRVGSGIPPLFSDTGGQHAAMIDSDQAVGELLPQLLRATTAHSGQHPASLRVLYLEEAVADRFETALIEALPHLRIGQPELRSTDSGPLATRERMDLAYLHIERFRAKGRLIAQCELQDEHEEGYFIPPTLIRLYTLDELQEQIEAPILHLVRFNREEINRTVDEINRSGYAMALSLFSNDPELCGKIEQHLRASELNLNPATLFPFSRSCPGSGIGLSGTAPLPGTPEYLQALQACTRVSRSAPRSD